MNPEQPIAVLGLDAVRIDFQRQRDFATKNTLIDLERDHLQRWSAVRVPFKRLPHAANVQARGSAVNSIWRSSTPASSTHTTIWSRQQ
jgi:hypothetical protein